MKKWISSFAALGLLSAVGLFAQEPAPTHTRPTAEQMIANHVSRLTTLLTLTSAQQTQATTIFTNEQTAMSSIQTSMKAAHSALKTAIENNDTAGITAQATQIGTLTTQEIEGRAQAQAAFYALLTSDQQTKYKQLEASGPMGRGFGGPGGFGRP
ncbi:MAG: Spy/CpxP family protein refolding chaperone [Bryobacteraceae bacterium]